MLAMKDLKIGFIGGGNMARALIAGLVRQGAAPANIVVGEPVAGLRAALARNFGVTVAADNATAVDKARAVLLAVKPQELGRVLTALRAEIDRAHPLLISIAAGIRVANLQAWCPGHTVVRAMPNRPALVGAGATGLYAPPGTAAADCDLAARILGSAGRCVWVPEESALDIVTALSGSGPAYFFLLAEQLAAAAVKLGLDADTARTLAAETLYGAGALAHVDHDLAGQRAAVTSKGGTTEAALKIMAGESLNALIQAAVSAATRRSSELADQFGNEN